MYKKSLLLLFLFGSLFAIIGCGGENPPSSGPLLMVEVRATESGTFEAWGSLKDTTTQTDLNATITVDGTPVVPDQGIALNNLYAGKTIKIIASHSKIGTIQRTFTVPQIVSDLHATNEAAITDWRERRASTLTLYWNGGDGDFYMISVNGRSSSGTNRPWRQSPATIDAGMSNFFLDEEPEPQSVSIRVKGVKYDELDNLGLFPGSKFEVQGPYCNVLFEGSPF